MRIILLTVLRAWQYNAHAMDAKPLLHAFAQRLRSARERAGMTLSELAERAEVSRRYVTEAEAGRANPSLAKLAALADALGWSLSDFVDLPLRTYRGERLALIGLRGAGKSTVGRLLADRLEVPFVELDQRVEEAAGMSLAELFELHGADHFHRLEAEILEEVLGEGDRVVLAVGGSIVDVPRTFDRLRRTCRTVWLRAEPEEHFQRVFTSGDRRPMRDRPRAMEELRELLASREPLYARCEHEITTSDKSADEVARAIERWSEA